jgi:hypothetical protein
MMMYDHESIARALLNASLDNFLDSDGVIKCCVEASVAQKAAELLKAQEPVLLENQHKPYGHSTNANSPWISRCPKCGKKIEGKQTRFCKYCGQAVKWK